MKKNETNQKNGSIINIDGDIIINFNDRPKRESLIGVFAKIIEKYFTKK